MNTKTKFINLCKEIIAIAKTCFQSFKVILSTLRKKQWLKAVKEIGYLFETIYKQHLKGKYVEIKGLRIPMVLVVIIVVYGLYVIYPSSDEAEFNEVKAPEETVELNTYDQNGIKVYNLELCDESVCGLIENYGEQIMEEVVVTVTFYADDDIAVCKSQAVASNLAPTAQVQFSVPCTIDFTTFKLTDVKTTVMEN